MRPRIRVVSQMRLMYKPLSGRLAAGAVDVAVLRGIAGLDWFVPTTRTDRTFHAILFENVAGRWPVRHATATSTLAVHEESVVKTRMPFATHCLRALEHRLWQGCLDRLPERLFNRLQSSLCRLDATHLRIQINQFFSRAAIRSLLGLGTRER